MSRSKAREAAFQFIYSIDLKTRGKINLSKGEVQQQLDSWILQMKLFQKSRPYLRFLVRKIFEEMSFIDQKIKSYLPVSWKFERLSFMDRNILRLGVSELFFVPKIAPKVVITESLKIAKVFSVKESSVFINGVLASVLKEISKEKEKIKVKTKGKNNICIKTPKKDKTNMDIKTSKKDQKRKEEKK